MKQKSHTIDVYIENDTDEQTDGSTVGQQSLSEFLSKRYLHKKILNV